MGDREITKVCPIRSHTNRSLTHPFATTQLELRAFPGTGAGCGRFLGRVKVLANSTVAFSRNRRCRKAPVLRAVAYSNMRSHGVTHNAPETQISRFAYLSTDRVRVVRYHCCGIFNSQKWRLGEGCCVGGGGGSVCPEPYDSSFSPPLRSRQ